MAAVTSKQVKFIGNGQKVAYSSGSTTIGVSFQSTYAWQLDDVRFRVSTGIAKGSTFRVSIISGLSPTSNHNIKLVEESMANVDAVFYQPTRPIRLTPDDTVKVTWTDATTHKWGLSATFTQF